MNLLLVTWKELIHLRRDRRASFIIVAFPTLVLIMYGYALNFDVRHLSFAVVDYDRTDLSREFATVFTHGGYFDLCCILESATRLEQALENGTAKAGLVIPKGFAEALLRGEPITVQALIDGTNSNTAVTALGYLQGFTLNYVLKKVQSALQGLGASLGPLASSVQTPFDLRLMVLYNPTLETARFLIPGLIGIILTVMAVISTALSIVREKERGTMDMLKVTPIGPFAVVVGKTIPYLLLALAASAMVLLAGWVIFGVEVKGSIFLLFVVLVLFLFGALAMGVFISSLTDSAQVAFTLATTLTMLPSFILSGFVFPLESTPPFIRAVSYFIPARYIIAILRAIVLKGEGISAFSFELLCLFAFAALMTILAALRVRSTMQ